MIAAVAVPAMSMTVRHYELGMFVDKPVVTKSQLAEIPIVPITTSYEISTPAPIQYTRRGQPDKSKAAPQHHPDMVMDYSKYNPGGAFVYDIHIRAWHVAASASFAL
jgi:hypothetical protein